LCDPVCHRQTETSWAHIKHLLDYDKLNSKVEQQLSSITQDLLEEQLKSEAQLKSAIEQLS
jgi:hypothetical protein